ncbi:MAG: hypothetical protein MJ230_07675, partial [bacterium]|nr:hypothetical protein [bacterium]
MSLHSENKCFENVEIAQINLLAGGLKENSQKIARAIRNAEENKLNLVIFPENALIGILPDEVLLRYPFIIDESLKWLDGLSKLTLNTNALVSFVDKNLKQSIALLTEGKII